MLMRPVRRSNYAKWSGKSTNYFVKLELRPKLDKWDVIFIKDCEANSHYWYMYAKTERFSTMQEAIVFILNKFSDGEVQIQDRCTNEVTNYNPKEIQMSGKAVTTLTLVYGKDANHVTDEEIFAHIKRLEDEIKKLNSIEHKPEKLSKKIDELKKDIGDLVTVVDGR